jgi:hypothetical protein
MKPGMRGGRLWTGTYWLSREGGTFLVLLPVPGVPQRHGVASCVLAAGAIRQELSATGAILASSIAMVRIYALGHGLNQDKR